MKSYDKFLLETSIREILVSLDDWVCFLFLRDGNYTTQMVFFFYHEGQENIFRYPNILNC